MIRTILAPATIGMYISQIAVPAAIPTDTFGWADLVERFGMWVIWLAIAVYLFKRGEAKDNVDRADRAAVEQARLEAQANNAESIKNLLLMCIEAINDGKRQTRILANRMRFCPATVKPATGEDQDEEDGKG
jgi:hypothetical protein